MNTKARLLSAVYSHRGHLCTKCTAVQGVLGTSKCISLGYTSRQPAGQLAIQCKITRAGIVGTLRESKTGC